MPKIYSRAQKISVYLFRQNDSLNADFRFPLDFGPASWKPFLEPGTTYPTLKICCFSIFYLFHNRIYAQFSHHQLPVGFCIFCIFCIIFIICIFYMFGIFFIFCTFFIIRLLLSSCSCICLCVWICILLDPNHIQNPFVITFSQYITPQVSQLLPLFVSVFVFISVFVFVFVFLSEFGQLTS